MFKPKTMKNTTLTILFFLFLFSCKKENEVCPVTVITPNASYTPTSSQDTVDVEYIIKTKVKWYKATYTKFAGFNADGSPILLSITDTITKGNDTIRFKSIKSQFGLKYHYQIFTLAKVSDTLLLSVSINDTVQAYRPNYGSVFNFVFTDY